MNKKCRKCSNIKPITDFCKNKTKKDGLTGECKQCIRDYNKWYRDTHKQTVTRARRNWKKQNQKRVNKYELKRKSENINYRLSSLLRSRLSAAIRYKYKSGSAVRDLGCSIEEFKKYIEIKFQSGMTWDNWSRDGWHIDHIKPLRSFNLENPQELRAACHYTNLQPLWADDNLRKIKEDLLY